MAVQPGNELEVGTTAACSTDLGDAPLYCFTVTITSGGFHKERWSELPQMWNSGSRRAFCNTVSKLANSFFFRTNVSSAKDLQSPFWFGAVD
jgi:hypothetical protein